VAIHIRGVTIPLVLQARAEYLLGREGQGDVTPDVSFELYRGRELGVSRVHALMRIVHQKVYLIDLGSTNGTRVNDNQLSPHQPRQVANGDEVRLGKLYFRIYFNLEPSS
jgi:pSer/pThr/pTyr-binding forkhead associated (FHA) protein